MPLWRLEPSAVKVARWVLRETALGNKCRPPDRTFLADLLTQLVFGQKRVERSRSAAERDKQ
ncbi:hypothetical protein [Vibrio genomosp. F6]|uniref:hypothetical protein n=1 Tax=Vibrio genomosp. F6 TaxID=723172 RepID=UPI001483667F|nr:hypothetical protein [Vibrio genomosp. F6]